MQYARLAARIYRAGQNIYQGYQNFDKVLQKKDSVQGYIKDAQGFYRAIVKPRKTLPSSTSSRRDTATPGTVRASYTSRRTRKMPKRYARRSVKRRRLRRRTTKSKLRYKSRRRRVYRSRRRYGRRRLLNAITNATIQRDPNIRLVCGRWRGTTGDTIGYGIGGLNSSWREALTFGPIEIAAVDTALGVTTGAQKYCISNVRINITLTNASTTIQTIRCTWYKIKKHMPNVATQTTLAQWAKNAWAQHATYPAPTDQDPVMYLPTGTSIYDAQRLMLNCRKLKSKTCKVLPGTTCHFKITPWKRLYRNTDFPIASYAGIKGQKFMLLESWGQPFADTVAAEYKSGKWDWIYRIVRRYNTQANLTPQSQDYSLTIPSAAAFTTAENTMNPASDTKVVYDEL